VIEATENFISCLLYFGIDLVSKLRHQRINLGFVTDLVKLKAFYLVELLPLPLFKAMNHCVLKKLPTRDAVNLQCLRVAH